MTDAETSAVAADIVARMVDIAARKSDLEAQYNALRDALITMLGPGDVMIGGTRVVIRVSHRFSTRIAVKALDDESKQRISKTVLDSTLARKVLNAAQLEACFAEAVTTVTLS